MRKIGLFCGCLFLGLWTFLVSVNSTAARFTRTLPPELATPSIPLTLVDLYHQIEASNLLVDQFLVAMGETKHKNPELSIHNAQPRDVEVEANALYAHARLLAFVYTRETYPLASELPKKGNSLEKSWLVLNQILRILYELQPILDRNEPLKITEIETTNYSDLTLALINLIEKMDDLAWFEYSPSESFQTVTQGVYIAAALIEQSPEPQPIPQALAFKRGGTSVENYQRLLNIMSKLCEIGKLKNIPFIQIEATDISTAMPDDVNNLAVLINAQLLYLYQQIIPNGSVLNAYYPGWKFPAHVYQRESVLEQQINQLLHIARTHPAWLMKKQVKNE